MLSGTLRVSVDGEAGDATAGDVVLVPSGAGSGPATWPPSRPRPGSRRRSGSPASAGRVLVHAPVDPVTSPPEGPLRPGAHGYPHDEWTGPVRIRSARMWRARRPHAPHDWPLRPAHHLGPAPDPGHPHRQRAGAWPAHRPGRADPRVGAGPRGLSGLAMAGRHPAPARPAAHRPRHDHRGRAGPRGGGAGPGPPAAHDPPAAHRPDRRRAAARHGHPGEDTIARSGPGLPAVAPAPGVFPSGHTSTACVCYCWPRRCADRRPARIRYLAWPASG